MLNFEFGKAVQEMFYKRFFLFLALVAISLSRNICAFGRVFMGNINFM